MIIIIIATVSGVQYVVLYVCMYGTNYYYCCYYSYSMLSFPGGAPRMTGFGGEVELGGRG